MRWGKKHSHGSHVRYLRTLKGMIGMLRAPENTVSVFDIEDGLRDTEATKMVLAKVKESPEVAKMMEERYLAPKPDMDALDKLPEGTLGKCFARQILDHGFDPDYFRKIDVKDDLDWVLMRIRQTHDLWHVLTGFYTDRFGEIGLKTFELAQTRRPMAAVIAAGGVLRYVLKHAEGLDMVMWAIAHGYRMGTEVKPLLAQKWEEGWDRPLKEWQDHLGITEARAESPYLPLLQQATQDDVIDEIERDAGI